MIDNVAHAERVVLQVGPAPEHVGGMSAVLRTIRDMDGGGRFRQVIFPFTFCDKANESCLEKVARHAQSLKRLGRVIQGENAALVHLHTCSGNTFYRSLFDVRAAKRWDRKVVLHVHGGAFLAFYRGSNLAGRYAIRRGLSAADRVIVLSESWRRELCRIAPNARVTVVENAVSTPSFIPKAVHDGPCRFLLLGRMDEAKGIEEVLQACRRIHAAGEDVEVVLAGLAGDAGDAKVLARRIAHAGLESAVRYVGAVEGEKKSSLFRYADAYLQPSHFEGMPLAVLEALAHGLPVIASRVGSLPEVVVDGVHGRLVPPRDADALAQAMMSLAREEERRVSISRACATFAASRFSLERFRNELCALYDDVLRGGAQPQATDHPAYADADSKWIPTGV